MKRIWKWLAIVLGAAALIVPLLFAVEGDPFPEPEQQILEVWHMDLFEGGRNSRADFLKRCAITFQRQYTGKYFLVRSVTLHEAEAKLEQGAVPDIVSLSIGGGELFEPYARPYTGAVNVRDDLLESGKLNGSVTAVPWCMGGYILAAYEHAVAGATAEELLKNPFDARYQPKKGTAACSVGMAEFNNPFAGLLAAGGGGVWQGEALTQSEAYSEFLAGKSGVLLGTQRDLYKLCNRKSMGTISPLLIRPLSGYTDLVNYLVITCQQPENTELCERFIEAVTSDATQGKLTELSLFAANGQKLYSEEDYAALEQVLAGELSVPNVFLSQAEIEAERSLAIQKLREQA